MSKLGSPEDIVILRIEEFTRGSIIEYQETRPMKPGFGKWFKDVVWGLTSDEDGVDHLEIGQFGCNGFIELNCVKGIEITEDMMLDYGFIITKNQDNHLLFYRDDFGFVRISTYGIEHVYMLGRPIQYLHNFQRIFLDYTGKNLHPKATKAPKEYYRAPSDTKKKKGADEMLADVMEMKSRIIEVGGKDVVIEVDTSAGFALIEQKRKLLMEIDIPIFEYKETQLDLDL